MSTTSNVSTVAVALQRVPVDLAAALAPELDELARLIQRRMAAKAASWRNTLRQSIAVDSPSQLERTITPGAAHAQAVEDGVPAGGKGLPRFFDPASASIVDWLRSKAFAGRKRIRKGSLAHTAAELELRDRYEGLAWHIRHHGVKAQPYVRPAFEEMEPVARVRLIAAVQAGLRANAAAAGGTAP